MYKKNPMPHQILVALHKNLVYAKIVGLGNFNNAGIFREFMDNIIRKGVAYVIIDMSSCQGLDSTFMGTMMGLLSCPLQEGGKPQELQSSNVQIKVVNPTQATKKAMHSLGLHTILNIQDDFIDIPDLKLKPLKEGWTDKQARVRLIQEAHEHLVRLDKNNQARFGPFLSMLLEDLKRH